MDGIHDLGGRQGFGRVDVNEPEESFHEEWEGRLYGLVKSMTMLPDWNLDWFRHCRELMDPVDYLTRPYFDQWAQTYSAMLINSGAASVEELASGKSQFAVPNLKPPMRPDMVQRAKATAPRYDRQNSATPSLSVGDAVTAKTHGTNGHTRLPAYARGRRGIIAAYHGNHVLPDANVHGDDRAEPIYSVVFEAAELWPEATGRRDRVFLDLWGSYLVRA